MMVVVTRRLQIQTAIWRQICVRRSEGGRVEGEGGRMGVFFEEGSRTWGAVGGWGVRGAVQVAGAVSNRANSATRKQQLK